MNRDKITVYIPTHNRVDLLKRACESVINQSYTNLELIVVDDGSSDDTWSYLKNLKKSDERVLIFRNEISKGACVSRNIAIDHATGKYITGLDDDDYFALSRLDNFYSSRDNLNQYSFLSSSVIPICDKNILRNELYNSKRELLLSELSNGNNVGNQVFTLTKRLKTIKAFDANLNCWQDYDLWIRLCCKYGNGLNLSNADYYLDVDPKRERITNSPRKINGMNFFIDKHYNLLSQSFKSRYKAYIYVYGGIRKQGKCDLLFLFFSVAYGVKKYANLAYKH
ncbi:GalNAc(5)-diNAcBac-PP-undecaprenol beta-1,3-glucosyltransferase [Vibrio celticus]|uniref:GalNAc(5)-diNAcBac-PP-undecaprenol beta-1,3-glucosyltransferase n=2 Tax=Vibrio celticus TaxID=446372 RepID=A0A1C3J973_9VIBR|nr:GalNAc(5)-diNAcBac-PP-undecaprenol beta-1,3-glucosyltransferase [Vibrio celticus]